MEKSIESIEAIAEETLSETKAAEPEIIEVEVTEETAEESAETAEEQDSKSKKKVKCWLIALIIIVSVLVLLTGGVFGLYHIASAKLDAGDYSTARSISSTLSFISPFEELSLECDYNEAEELFNDGCYIEAYELYTALGNYSDSEDKAQNCIISYGEALLIDGKFDDAIKQFESLDDKSAAEAYILGAKYFKAYNMYENGKYAEARELFLELEDFNDSELLAAECELCIALEMYKDGKYAEASELFYKYYGQNMLAEAYFALCYFHYTTEGGVSASYDVTQGLQLLLEPYTYEFPETAEALEAPFFFTLKFFGNKWQCGDAVIDATDSKNSFVYSNLPWGEAAEEINYFTAQKGMYFQSGMDLWFVIYDFSPDNDEMYVMGCDSAMYTFTKAVDAE